jgi:hypothetical protein
MLVLSRATGNESAAGLPLPDAEDGPPETVLRGEHAAGREIEAAIVHAALVVLGVGIELDRLAVPGLTTGTARLESVVVLVLQPFMVLVMLAFLGVYRCSDKKKL